MIEKTEEQKKDARKYEDFFLKCLLQLDQRDGNGFKNPHKYANETHTLTLDQLPPQS